MLGGEAIGELAPQFRELEELATAELVAEGLRVLPNIRSMCGMRGRDMS